MSQYLTVGHQTEDVVIEIKIRLSGLEYDDAKVIRDTLRDPESWVTMSIAEDLVDVAKEIAPGAEVKAFNPWAEWRPAQGKRQKKMEGV